jgi:hypothetical protein
VESLTVKDEMYVEFLNRMNATEHFNNTVHLEPDGSVLVRDHVIRAIELATAVTDCGTELYRMYKDEQALQIVAEHDELIEVLLAILETTDRLKGIGDRSDARN